MVLRYAGDDAIRTDNDGNSNAYYPWQDEEPENTSPSFGTLRRSIECHLRLVQRPKVQVVTLPGGTELFAFSLVVASATICDPDDDARNKTSGDQFPHYD